MKPTANETQESVAAVFNWVAPRYDATFTDTPHGIRQRRVVYQRLLPLLRPEFRVLELNCGTGHDAIELAQRTAEVIATDISPEMIRITASRAAASPVSARIHPRLMAIEDLQSADIRQSLGRFDLIFSDFDGLNCIGDLSWLPQAAASLLKPGGQIVFVFMNRAWLPILLGRAALRPDGEVHRENDQVTWHFGDGHKVKTWFHAIPDVRRAFVSRFDLQYLQAVRLVSPPPLLGGLYQFLPELFDRVDDFLSPLAPFNRWGQRVLFHLRLKDS